MQLNPHDDRTLLLLCFFSWRFRPIGQFASKVFYDWSHCTLLYFSSIMERSSMILTVYITQFYIHLCLTQVPTTFAPTKMSCDCIPATRNWMTTSVRSSNNRLRFSWLIFSMFCWRFWPRIVTLRFISYQRMISQREDSCLWLVSSRLT